LAFALPLRSFAFALAPALAFALAFVFVFVFAFALPTERSALGLNALYSKSGLMR
jgi:hypothetical protein